MKMSLFILIATLFSLTAPASQIGSATNFSSLQPNQSIALEWRFESRFVNQHPRIEFRRWPRPQLKVRDLFAEDGVALEGRVFNLGEEELARWDQMLTDYRWDKFRGCGAAVGVRESMKITFSEGGAAKGRETYLNRCASSLLVEFVSRTKV